MRSLPRKKSFSFPVSTLIGSTFSNFKVVLKGREISIGYKSRYFTTKWISWILELFRLAEVRKYGNVIENHKIEEPPIFIIGFWRSGTTLLHNLMCQNPDYGFTNTFQAVFPNHSLLNRGWLKAISKQMLPEKRPGDNVKFDFEYPQEEEIALGNMQPLSFYNFFYFPQDTEEFINKSLLFKGVTDEELKTWEEKYITLIKTALINTNGKRYVSKNPPNTFRIKRLLKMFPDAKFIYIERDIYETLNSFLRFTRAVREGIKHQDYDHEKQDLVLIRLYKLMRKQYNTDKKLIPEGQLVEIKFEYFENNKLEEIERVYNELGLQNFDKAYPLMKSYLDKIGDYKRKHHKLDAGFIELIDKELGELIEDNKPA